MYGIVVAAGLGSRMKELTHSQPKCMLPVAKRPILHWSLERMQQAGCDTLAVTLGYLAEKVDSLGAARFLNSSFRENNILHSLIHAREVMKGPGLVSYSDIWVEPEIYHQLAQAEGDLVLAVDRDWMPYYDGRLDTPLHEAEKAYYDTEGRIFEIGKHIGPTPPPNLQCGEFLGIWKMSAAGTEAFLKSFDAVHAKWDSETPFEHAAVWRKAYITDLLEYMIREGATVKAMEVSQGWAEFDTQEDYERLSRLAKQQKLFTLLEHSA